MYLNRVELIGYLGSNAEGKSTPNGKAVTTLSLATKTSFLKDGARQERTEWHRIQVWGKLGEYAAAFKKGSHIRVEGELRSREYETEGGTKVRTYDIVANSILNLRAGQRNSVQEPDAPEAPAAEPPAAESCAEPLPPRSRQPRRRPASARARQTRRSGRKAALLFALLSATAPAHPDPEPPADGRTTSLTRPNFFSAFALDAAKNCQYVKG